MTPSSSPPAASQAARYRYATVQQAAHDMRAGEIDAVSLVAACEAAFEADNGLLNAVVVSDFDAAYATAEARDEERRAGRLRGPLHGIPFTIKESFDVRGWPTTLGDPAHRENIASANADVVQRLLDAGAVLLGKTNVPIYLRDWQSYNDLYGTTRNPRDPSRTPGGSSGGSAAAVCAGMSFFDVGSDVGSSIRNPAHFCGVFSHKTTHGIVSLKGHGIGGGMAQPDINVAGPLARSARDLELVLGAIAGPAGEAASALRLALPPCERTDLREFRFGVLTNHPLADVDGPVEACLTRLGRQLEDAGATVVWDARPALDAAQLMRAYVLLLRASTSHYLDDDAFAAALTASAAVPADASSYAALQYAGTALRHRDWLLLQKQRDAFCEAWRELFGTIDVLLCPAAATAAFTLDETGAPWQRTLDVNGRPQPMTTQLFWAGHSGLCGLPSTVARAGTTADGLPIGVQIVAPLYHDLRSLRVAALLEQAGLSFVAPPL
ncbi:amidase [Paraburkholderia tuberum]|uniref:Amidase n=1 Tax=Paraburkholderia tuberum TaxID=157910 RepID=A0A1H1JJ77_9BURK|nr:amidase [Paraburkholderia tuberum]SDR49779.1 amidase [Paraburkholderia tuberum]